MPSSVPQSSLEASQIQTLASLAKLHFSSTQSQELQIHLEKVFQWIQILDTLNMKEILNWCHQNNACEKDAPKAPCETFFLVDPLDHLRQDQAWSQLYEGVSDQDISPIDGRRSSILSNAPMTEQGFFLTPPVMDFSQETPSLD